MMRALPAITLIVAALCAAALAAPSGQTPAMPPMTPSVTPGMPPSAQSATPNMPPGAPAARSDKAEGVDKNAPEAGTAKAFYDIDFVWVPAGTFVPGLSDGAKKVVTTIGGREEWFSDEAARREERFSRGFWMSKTEITRRQWSRVMDSKPWADHNADDQLDVPATWIAWKDAAAFAKTLVAEGEPPCRLPTENEWEYACRAGTTMLFPFGDDAALLDEYAWYRGTAPDGKPRPVAGKKPNAWGLYDMLGNAWEWCSDAYGGEPTGEGADFRVIRGGSANQPATFTRPTVRLGRPAKAGDARIGFRIVREP